MPSTAVPCATNDPWLTCFEPSNELKAVCLIQVLLQLAVAGTEAPVDIGDDNVRARSALFPGCRHVQAGDIPLPF